MNMLNLNIKVRHYVQKLLTANILSIHLIPIWANHPIGHSCDSKYIHLAHFLLNAPQAAQKSEK